MAKAIPNHTKVGGCYDILEVDPIKITKDTRKRPDAFDLGLMEDIPDQEEWKKPRWLKFSAAFGGDSSRGTTEISSSYDYHRNYTTSGSLTVSDATGLAFSGTLSASFQAVKKETTGSRSVITIANHWVDNFSLEVETGADDLPACDLSNELKTAFQQLPETPSEAYDKFVRQFGTHYCSAALFGGRAMQKISISSDDYVSLVQENVRITAETEATLWMHTKAAAGKTDERDTKFTRARSLHEESVVYIGGDYTQEYLDMWKMQVPHQPMPIQATFEPLYKLLIPDKVLEPTEQQNDDKMTVVSKKKRLLQEAIDRHVSKGFDPKSSLIHYGDIVALELATPGPSRVLSSEQGADSVHTVRWEGDIKQLPQAQRWVLINCSNPNSKDEVNAEPKGCVLFRNAVTGMLLDGQAGSDPNYRGRGLAGAVEKDPTQPGAQWTLEILGGDKRKEAGVRTEVVDGDIVRLQSRWRFKDRADTGFLQGEPKVEDEQHVYGFGVNNSPGVFWRVRRVSPVSQ